jgi:hypothetical protein
MLSKGEPVGDGFDADGVAAEQLIAATKSVATILAGMRCTCGPCSISAAFASGCC